MKRAVLNRLFIVGMTIIIAFAGLASFGLASSEVSTEDTEEETAVSAAGGGEEAVVELTDTEKVETSDDITDAATADYIISSLNEEYIKNDFFELVNYMVVKQTIVDGDAMDGETTIDGMVEEDIYADAVLTILQATVGVYDLSNDSDYLVAYANTMFSDEGYDVYEVLFALYNDYGDAVDGCIYDENTGLVYVPKTLYLDEDDDESYVLGQIQVQFLQVSKTDDIEELESGVEAVLETDNNKVQTGEDTISLFDFETSVEAEPGLDEDELIVSVNGIPTDDYEYDEETGTVTVPYSSAVVQSVSVKVEEESLVAKIADLFEPITASADTTSYGSKNSLSIISDGTIVFKGTPTVGTLYSDTLSYYYGSDMDDDETTSTGAYGGATDSAAAAIVTYLLSSSSYSSCKNYTLTHYANRTFLIKLKGTYGSNDDIDFSDINEKLALFCAHITKGVLGAQSGNVQGKWSTIGSRIRVLKVDSTNKVVVLGFVTQYVGGQTGYGIVAFYYEEEVDTVAAYSYLDLTKLGIDDDGNAITSTTYSRAGAVYTVYADAACTTVVYKTNGKKATLNTKNASGTTNGAIKIPLNLTSSGSVASGSTAYASGGNMVYVKETDIADSGAYYINTTVYTVDLTENGIDSSKSTLTGSDLVYVYKTVYVGDDDVVYDPLITIPFTIQKVDSDDDTFTEFEGTTYTIYDSLQCDSDGNIKTDSNGQPKVSGRVATLSYVSANGCFNTVDLSPGFYYIKETAATDDYDIDEHVYTLSIIVTYYSAGYYKYKVTIKKITAVTDDTYTSSSYGKGNTTFTGSNAEDLSDAGSIALMYFTVTTNSDDENTIKLYSGQHGKTSTVSDLGVQVTFYDAKETIPITLVKSAASSAKVTPVTSSAAYSLEGATYYVYTNSSCTTRATDINGDAIEFVTASNGKTDTVYVSASEIGKTYYVKEISSSTGYLVNSTVSSITLIDGTNKFSVTESVDTTSLFESGFYKKDTNGNVIKRSGIQFKLTYYYLNSSYVYTKAKTLYYQTDSNGYIDFSDTSYLVSSKSSTPYTDSSGNIVFYYGYITIEETKTATNYELNEEIEEIYITFDSDNYLTYSMSNTLVYKSGSTYYAPNEWKAYLQIYKKNAYTGGSAGSGFTFTLTNTSTSESVSDTTDTDGYAAFEDLESGTYTLQETAVPNTYPLCTTTYTVVVDTAARTVTVQQDGSSKITTYDDSGSTSVTISYTITNTPYVSLPIIKTASNDTSVIIQNVYFQLCGYGNITGSYYNKTGHTGSDGTLTFTKLEPGTYTLTETDASSAIPSVIESEQQWTVTIASDGTITVTSDDETWTTTVIEYGSGDSLGVGNEVAHSFIVQKVSELDNTTPVAYVEFTLYDTANKISTSATTSLYGYATWSDLQSGTYILTETDVTNSSPSSVLDSTPRKVVISDSGTITVYEAQKDSDGNVKYSSGSVVYESTGTVVTEGYAYVITDEMSATFSVYKRDSANAYPVAGVVYRLYSSSSDIDYDEIATTDETGYAYFYNLEPGKYVLKETDVSDSYYTYTDDDGNTVKSDSPAVNIDDSTWILTVTVSDGKYSMTITDGTNTTTLGSSFVYTVINTTTLSGRIPVIKHWVTNTISKIYSAITGVGYSILDAVELPVIHLVTDGEDAIREMTVTYLNIYLTDESATMSVTYNGVTYTAENGVLSIEIDEEDIENGLTFADVLGSVEPVCSGRTFLGWLSAVYDDDDEISEYVSLDTSTALSDSEMAVYASWTPVLTIELSSDAASFSFTYNGTTYTSVVEEVDDEGNTVTTYLTELTVYLTNTTTMLSGVIGSSTPTTSDYDFAGWLYNGDDIDSSYVISEDMTIYASWEEEEEILLEIDLTDADAEMTITYNGSTYTTEDGVMTITVVNGDSFYDVIGSEVPTLDGATFEYWYTSCAATETLFEAVYGGNTAWTNALEMTVFAEWAYDYETITLTVYYMTNPASNVFSSQEYTLAVGSSLSDVITSLPVYSGYAFVGYYTIRWSKILSLEAELYSDTTVWERFLTGDEYFSTGCGAGDDTSDLFKEGYYVINFGLACDVTCTSIITYTSSGAYYIGGSRDATINLNLTGATQEGIYGLYVSNNILLSDVLNNFTITPNSSDWSDYSISGYDILDSYSVQLIWEKTS